MGDPSNVYTTTRGYKECRECARLTRTARRRQAGIKPTFNGQRFCKRGHDKQAPGGGYVNGWGATACQACRLEAGRRRRQREKEARARSNCHARESNAALSGERPRLTIQED